MNKYTGLSDFEINLMVARIRLVDGNYGWCAHTRFVKRYVTDDKGLCMTYDPCNNPTDAMPIIIENNISLRAPTITDRWKAEFIDEYGNYVGYRRALNKNPLRAAMELFLLMKDAENEKV
ncbi:DUF2591 domain-containing protein [Providencia alcalifaciens]|uniref:phage protein NinX family protein n=1 Tax=Providencia alcalifaciens TaxID=126385 RepID=UPI0012B5DFB2|nr:phage protein NinX family protein [Providencia alcalifaciens]MTC54979.1 DUF2591 domain-containing protein [Providencia alcalifaciens]